ncbi:MAG: hypothetical protein Q9M14_04965 [Mariprofundaceae bacterium]|nr:hypothetical protein [Mariprofundaceae bacterium]
MRKPLHIAIAIFLLSACSTLQPTASVRDSNEYKPWHSFNGQLSILESAHRWQVLIHWQATLESGKARLTHAATGRIIELQWQGEHIQIRDNQTSITAWQPIKADTLMQYGMVLPPQTIAAILHYQIPPSLKAKGNDTWQGLLHNNTIRLRWQNHRHKLTMTDITHGRTAILRIFP